MSQRSGFRVSSQRSEVRACVLGYREVLGMFLTDETSESDRKYVSSVNKLEMRCIAENRSRQKKTTTTTKNSQLGEREAVSHPWGSEAGEEGSSGGGTEEKELSSETMISNEELCVCIIRRKRGKRKRFRFQRFSHF